MRRLPLALATLGFSMVLAPLPFAGPASAATAQAATSRVIISPEPGRIVRSHLLRVTVAAASHPNAIRATLNGVRVDDQFGARRAGVRSMSASVSDGLRRGRNVLRVTTRRRGGTSRTATVRFTVRTAGPLVGAGQNRRVAVGTPVRLAGVVRAARGRAQGRAGWRLESAPRRAATLGSPAGSAASLRPTAPGRYTIAFTSRTGGTARTDRVTLTAVPPSLLVPVDTDAGTADRPGIAIGATTYPADVPAGYTGGVAEVLSLDRTTLAVTTNRTYTEAQLGTLADDLAKPATPNRHRTDDLVVATYFPRQSQARNYFDQMTVFRAIGADDSIGDDGRVFSAIGVRGWKRGQADQTSNGLFDGADVGLRGYLTPDENRQYGYVPTTRATFEFRPEPLPDCTSACDENGYVVHAYDAQTLAPIASLDGAFFATNDRSATPAQDAAEANRMVAALKRLPAGAAVTIRSVGHRRAGETTTPSPIGPIDAATMERLTQEIIDVGGTRDAFTQTAVRPGAAAAGGLVYALAGWEGSVRRERPLVIDGGEGTGAEIASQFDDGVSVGPVAPSLSGVWRPDHQSQLRPSAATTAGRSVDGLAAEVMRAPSTDWRCGAVSCRDAPGVVAAMSWIGTNRVTQLGPDPRSRYGLARWNAAQLLGINTALTALKGNPAPAGTSFTQRDWDTAIAQLLEENGDIGTVRGYLQRLATPFTKGLTGYLDIQKIADQVFEDTRPPESDETAFQWADFTKILLGLFDHVSGGATGAIAELIDLGQWFAGATSEGAPTYDEISIKAHELGEQVNEQGNRIGDQLETMGDIIVSDPEKLAYFANADCAPGPKCPEDLENDPALPEESSTTYRRGVQSLAYQTLVPLGYRVYNLTQEGTDPGGPAHQGPWSLRPRAIDYICGAGYAAFKDVDPLATATTAFSVDPSLAGSSQGMWRYRTFVIAQPPARISDQHAVGAPKDLVEKMFGPVEDGGLAIPRGRFMVAAKPGYWYGDPTNEAHECWWGV